MTPHYTKIGATSEKFPPAVDGDDIETHSWAMYIRYKTLEHSALSKHSGTPLEKTDFSFARFQLRINSLLEVGPNVHFPLSVLGSHLS